MGGDDTGCVAAEEGVAATEFGTGAGGRRRGRVLVGFGEFREKREDLFFALFKMLVKRDSSAFFAAFGGCDDFGNVDAGVGPFSLSGGGPERANGFHVPDGSGKSDSGKELSKVDGGNVGESHRFSQAARHGADEGGSGKKLRSGNVDGSVDKAVLRERRKEVRSDESNVTDLR